MKPKKMQDIKVLVTDDSAFMRKWTIDILKKAGFKNFIEASNGHQAIEKFKSEKPDIMLLDIIMPGLTGIEALNELVKYKAKVIIVSAMGQEGIIEQAFQKGAINYFIKPFFDADEMKKKILDAIQNKTFNIEKKAQEFKFDQIAKEGSAKTAEALSFLLNEKINIHASEINLSTEFQVEKEIKNSKNSIIITSNFLDGIKGVSILQTSQKDALFLIDVMNKKIAGTDKTLKAKLDFSALKEILNIISNSYLTIVAKTFNFLITTGVPEITKTNQINNVIAKHLQLEKTPRPFKVLVFKVIIGIENTEIKIDLYFLFQKEISKLIK